MLNGYFAIFKNQKLFAITGALHEFFGTENKNGIIVNNAGKINVFHEGKY